MPIYLRDVARVELTHEKPTGAIFSLHNESIALNIQRQTGANELDIMNEVRKKQEKLNREVLGPAVCNWCMPGTRPATSTAP